MLLTLYLAGTVLALGWAKPVEQPRIVETFSSMYALMHPNTETEPNEEYGDLHEGDIILRDDEEMSDLETSPLNAVNDPRLLWPNGVAHYTIENGAYTPTQVRQIEEGIADLMRLTMVNGRNCITILPRNNEANFISVQFYSGCSSYVGRIGGSQRMSLVASCVSRHGTIMHEFLHAFGFHHEQKRSDRDDYITVVDSNIQPGAENNFVKLTPDKVDLLGTLYDYGSIMHYSAYAFAVDPSQPTIIPHDPTAEIGQRVTLSRLDIERVQILYGCLDPMDSVYFKHIDRESLFEK